MRKKSYNYRMPLIGLLTFLLLSALALAAPPKREPGYAAWLRYDAIDEPVIRQAYARMPAAIVALDESLVIKAAGEELLGGVRQMLGRNLRLESRLPQEDAILLGTLASLRKTFATLNPAVALKADGFWLKTLKRDGHAYLIITAANDCGVLYGAFALLRRLGLGQPIETRDEQENPYAPVRMLNHWDNLDGSIERGYAGPSIFFANDNVVEDLSRVRDYARLMASVGINSCSINNVNANPRVISSEFLPQLARVAAVFRPWGVRLFVSIDFSSPQKLGGLGTFDPLDPQVAQWWKKKVDEIY